MAESLLIDTDVLVDYLRGYGDAVEYLERQKGHLVISAITVAELYASMRGEEEANAIELFLKAFEVISVDSEIAARGGIYRREYRPSHGTGLADAIIAASAELKKAQLVTLNDRHFPMINTHVPYRKG